MKFSKTWFGFWLTTATCLIEITVPVKAQTPASRIDLVVVQGEGATNIAGQRAAMIPKVRVVNENQQPLPGAVVVFNLPISGTSGEFEKGSKNLTVTTDREGIATAGRLTLNRIPGRLQILVTARYRGIDGRALINQTVEGSGATASRGGTGKWIAILVIVGGAAAGGAVAFARKGNSSSSAATPAPIGITPGTVSITHP